jgi:indoleamine 2,3-dioxygenase
LGQVREPLSRLPVISTDELTTTEELRRAQLLLCLFAHAFVWGGTPVMEYIPRGISIPLWEVSCRLDTPPVLMNMAITLYNWRRLDTSAGLNMMNLSTLNNFFSGRDESWFYLITVEIEALGAATVVPLMQINSDIQRAKSVPATKMSGGEKHIVRNVILLESITSKLQVVADAIDKMTASLATMREGCHPFIFYHRVRPFLAGWKSNPALPNGVKYEGVYMKWQDRPIPSEDAVRSDNVTPVMGSPSKAGSWLSGAMKAEGKGGLDACPPQFFSGGSAAQSALLPFLDICLGIDHSAHDGSPNSNGFLASMREYMPRPHREFLKYLQGETCIREFMTSCRRELASEMGSSSAPDTDASSKSASSPAPGSVSGEKEEDGIETSTSTSDSSEPSNNPAVTWTWRGSGGVATAVTAEDGLDDRVYDALKTLCDTYDTCLLNFGKFRTGHISLVAEYILAQQRHGVSDKSIEGNAGGKGTGGTDLINFLKPIRDNCHESTLAATKKRPDDTSWGSS